MITTPKMLGLLAVAFVAGSFVASPELRAYAAATIGSADIIDESIQSVDIKNGQVKAADIATNAVGASEISDGTITYTDLSRSLVAIEHRDDCNCGGTGWDPDGTLRYEQIADARITLSSVVSATLVNVNNIACGTAQLQPGNVVVSCERNIPQGSAVNYAIFNK